MDREILFRGKRFDGGGWVEGSLLCWGERLDICVKTSCYGMDRYQVDSATVGQFTGLTDRHGVRIFEGDLITLESGKLCEVWWEKKGCRFLCGHPLRWGSAMHPAVMGRCKVVGNIHDNPDLRED